jgi:branched-chain amino acid transport system permease protein
LQKCGETGTIGANLPEPAVIHKKDRIVISSLPGVLFDGVAYGSLLFLISIGLSVTMGLMNFVNLAHGAFAMLGGYVAVVLMNRAGVPFLAALPLAFLGAAQPAGCLSARSIAGCTAPATWTRCCSRSA